jgi:folate-binding protein YgfZ
MNVAQESLPTVLRLEGRDALDVVQRISTQQLEDLAPGAGRTTLFCDFRGRLLHRAVVARTTDGALWLLRDDAPGVELMAHVDRHVFREDVRILDLSSQWSVRAEWTGDDDDAIREQDGVPRLAPEGHGFSLFLTPAGAQGVPFEYREHERILHGRPRHGHEIHPDWNPYEIGCDDEVHLAKGCYTGQEALQRLITYGSVRRFAACVRGRGPSPLAPCDVPGDRGPVGRVTSSISDDTPGRWVGIAILRRDVPWPEDGSASLKLEGGGVIDTVMAHPARRPLGRPADA